MLLSRPSAQVAPLAGAVLLVLLNSAAFAQRPSFANSRLRTVSNIQDDAVDALDAESDMPEDEDLESGLMCMPPYFIPNSIGGSFGACFEVDTLAGASVPLCPGFGHFDISRNNSAVPTDRVYYNFNYFHDALRVDDGVNAKTIDVQRHTFGAERTFWCDLASVGVEVPVAHTLASDLDPTANELTDVELGNVAIYLKTVLYQDACKTFSAGLGVDLPTADDLHADDGVADTIDLDNDVVILSPFGALLIADPCGNLFVHSFVQFDVPTDDYDIDVGGAGAQIDAPMVLHLDGSIGYWISRDCCGNGAAAIVELHYRTNLDGNETVDLGGVTVGNTIRSRDFDYLNVTAGLAVAHCCWEIAPAVVVPLFDRPDREFDWAAVLNVNRRF